MTDIINNGVPNPVMVYGRAPNGQLQAVTTDGAGNLSIASGSNVGPVINVTNPTYSGCPGTQDWTTCFASVVAAAATAAFAPAGGLAFKNQCTNNVLSGTTLSCNIAIAPGDTVLVFVFTNHINGQTITVADSSAANTYTQLNVKYNNGGSSIATTFGSPVQVANAATSVTVTDSPAEQIAMAVVSYTNVGAYGLQNSTLNHATGTSTAPALTALTQDNNDFIVTGVSWPAGSAITLAANVGNLRANTAASATLQGAAAIDNTGATPGNVTTSGTLSSSSSWVTQAIELRSGKPSIPTVYFPVGTYNYTSGLNFLSPTTLKCEPGAWLNYLGTAHAVDFGPTTLTVNNYQLDSYTIDSCRFMGGALMTQGIYSNNLVLRVEIKGAQFFSFGNATAGVYKIFSNGETDDYYIHDSYFYDTDGIPRLGFSSNNVATQLRFIGNVYNCTNGLQNGGACVTAAASTAVTTAGASSLIANNNFNFNCPNVLLSSVAGAYNTRIISNYFEGSNTCHDLIRFQTQDGVHIEQNFFNMVNQTFPIAPLAGTDILINALVAHNYSINMPLATELVQLNNVVGQVGNVAAVNMCATGVGSGTAPCAKLHTIAGNITQWNGDYAGTCTMSSGVCPTYTFIATYNAAPKCTASWTGAGTLTALAGGVTVASTTTTLIVSSKVLTDTAVMNWSCSPDAQ